MITTGTVAGLGAAIVLLDHEICYVAGVVAIAGTAAGGAIAGAVQDAGQGRHNTSWVVTAAVVAGVLCMSGTGLYIFLGRSGIWLAVLLMLASPTAVRCYGSAVRPDPCTWSGTTRPHMMTRAREVPDAEMAHRRDDPQPGVRTLTTLDVCMAWRTSFTDFQRVQASGDVTAQAKLAAVRQGYLDELERRDPRGFQRWLASGARPAGDPSTYLT